MVGAAVLLLASTARADWDEGDPAKMHWPQLPDLVPTGVDVDNFWTVLADDFRSTQTGPIKDIHLWYSFAEDMLPAAGVRNGMKFDLWIYSDDPVGFGGDPNEDPANPFSKPLDELWHEHFDGANPQAPFTARRVADQLDELFWDPATGNQTWDTKLFQYNFYPTAPYEQEEETVYWLVVKGFPNAPNPDATPGWKSSLEHWNDDAVFWDEGNPAAGWQELRYPFPHALQNESMDLAFVITPEPATLALLGLGVAGLLARRRRK